jgi:predicted AAA+ superfamily ATPase
MIFNRIQISALLEWKKSSDRKPLLLQGARQVGKTSLVKLFGKMYFHDFAYFNFEEEPLLKELFESTKKVDILLDQLSGIHGKKIEAETCLIFFDEIQECNSALNTLKYFHENAKEYAIIGAGSLLGITLGTPNSFPVGQVDFLNIYPLSFLEILEKSEANLYFFAQNIKTFDTISEVMHTRFLIELKNYFISGGMPEAARKFEQTKNIKETDKILMNILTSYSNDFTKHTSKNDAIKIGYIWDSLPSQLAKENKKFIFQTLKSGARARDYEYSLEWLKKSGLTYKVNVCKKPFLPLKAYDDLSSFKLYVHDIGVLRVLSNLDANIYLQQHDFFTEFKGNLMENYVIQSLKLQFDIDLRYWTSDGKAELDFILQYRNEIIPIEVKSAKNTQSKSMAVYNKKYTPKIRICFSSKNLNFENGLLNIPLYLIDKTSFFLDLLLDENNV